jgi:CDP-diacylglycerol--glycerol-3-phosphate 3-phosphatidyltransferase
MQLSQKLLSLRLRGRVWRIFRAALFLPLIACIWTEHNYSAVMLTLIVLILTWLNTWQLRVQETEEPYYQLWLNIIEGVLSVTVMTSILIRTYIKEDDFEILLAVGCGFLLARVIAHSLLSLSILREGKSLPGRHVWSKMSIVAINLTMFVYILNIERFQQIFMVANLLLMGAASASYLYWYYRDPAHRKPLSIASQLTMTRIVLTPFFLWVFFYDNDLNYTNNHIVFKALALVMVLGFMLTDYLDGHLARKWGEVSTLGKYLDPFSDKISNMTIFLCFIATGYAPVWMVALIYFREASVETLRTLAAAENVIMPARRSGKWKTAIQGIGIVVILVGALDPVQQIEGFKAVWEYLPTVSMGVITFVTLASGIDYFLSSKHILQKYV